MSKLYKLSPTVKIGSSEIVYLEVAQYGNGRQAVQLHSILAEEDGGDGELTEPFDTLSVNLPEQQLPDGTFFVRNYDYHAKTYVAFVNAGIIEPVEGVLGRVGMHGNCGAARLTAKATAISA